MASSTGVLRGTPYKRVSSSDINEAELSRFDVESAYSEIDSEFCAVSSLLSDFMEYLFKRGIDDLFGGVADLCERSLAELDCLLFLISRGLTIS